MKQPMENWRKFKAYNKTSLFYTVTLRAIYKKRMLNIRLVSIYEIDLFNH